MHRKVDQLSMAPGVSVIKPLMGVDSCLKDNLISHFTLDYPKFELLFCVQDEDDPVIPLVNSLREQYPHVDAQLLIGGTPGIVNPMVHNMAPAYAVAKYELVWISTSRILDECSNPRLEEYSSQVNCKILLLKFEFAPMKVQKKKGNSGGIDPR
ncbi:unnamed protein product [Echinostoma caproni]|uniref:Ceramide glucosyltransferase n=1 Tax=Echinostoma caproni TaxID=27848 RepID=A0A183B2D3_9TREM|nr:unnamed protein product [Echinostoma caproni]